MTQSQLDYICANNLSFFTEKVFNTLNPSTQYQHNWHVDAISDYLEACERKEIRNLIINMPPRFMKSISVSIAWTCYLLGKDPTRQVVCASYASSLAEKLSVDSRNVIQSDWYQRVFPEMRIAQGQNKKMWFSTEDGGHRYATSVGATVTGFGGDFLILDDPLNPEEAASDVKRQRCNDWITSTFLSRANNPKDYGLVLVMQRLHEDDPSGMLLGLKDQIGEFDQLILPAEFEKKTQIVTPSRTYEKERGSFLHEERLGKKEAAEKRALMGSYAYAGQYLQVPSPLGGGIIKNRWFKMCEDRPLKFDFLIHSWDTAIKANAGSDYSVCTVWGVSDGGYYLVDLHRGKWEYPDLKKKALMLAQRDKPDYILIEDKASGQALIQDLKINTRLNIFEILPSKDKITRMSTATPIIETGNVYLDANGYWLNGFMDECSMFPNSKHDDQVDSMSQFLNWVRENESKITVQESVVDMDDFVMPMSGWGA